MSSLLVTGGAGFIGSNFVLYWLGQYPGDRIIVLDALTYAGNKANLEGALTHPRLDFIEGDICDTALVEQLIQKYGVDTIVHFAAESHVDRSITGPDAFLETNIIGTHSLLKAAKTCWLDVADAPLKHRFHHVSTDEVYGTLTPDEPPFKETTAYAPNSPYAASKAASDHLVRAYHETYGLQVTTSNCSNNYGPLHFPEKLIPLVISNILLNKPLPIYGDGKQVRDWLYVEDHARGIELVLNKGRISETYNIGGNNEWHNIDIVKLICRLMNEAFDVKRAGPADSDPVSLVNKYATATAAINGDSESLITHVTDRLGHDRRYAIDASKSTSELGYVPQESFETGIAKTIAWYLKHDDWWQDLLARAAVHR